MPPQKMAHDAADTLRPLYDGTEQERGGTAVRRGKNGRAAEDMVRSLGVSCANESTCELICALEMIHTNENLIHSMQKLDEMVAGQFEGLTAGNIERNLRKARDDILEHGDPERLREVMGYLLRRRPSVASFLDALDYYMEREGLWPPMDSFES